MADKKKFMKPEKANKLLEVKKEKPKTRSAGEVREKLYGKGKS